MKYFAVIILLLVSPAFADEVAESKTVAIAKDYIAAYSTFDVSVMEPFLADDMVFFDPTSSTQNANGEPFKFEGKEAVMQGLGDYASQFESFALTYDVERYYESQDIVVFVAQLGYEGATKDGQSFAGGGPIVTAITVKDGKVVRHVDYFDYNQNAVELKK